MPFLFLYGIAIRLYYLLIWCSSPFNIKARRWIRGRRGLFKEIKRRLENDQAPRVWFHCASLGEFEQGRPVIEAFRREFPEYKIVLTFFSPSGYEARKDYGGVDYIFYVPLDTKGNAKKLISYINPKAAFFIKYEFWYHILTQLKASGTPVYLISAIFRPKQSFFMPYGKLFREMLGCVSHFFVQNGQSAYLLESVGITNITETGDTRFDRVYDIASQAKEVPYIADFKQDQLLLVAGSTWPDDEALLMHVFNRFPQLKLVIAPHEIDESHIGRLMSLFEGMAVLYSQAGKVNLFKTQVLVIDSIGSLAAIYRYADVAYVGGGFGRGIHNVLEPSTYGIPVVFGPHYHKFQEAVRLVELGGAFSFAQKEMLENKLLELFYNEVMRKNAAWACKQYTRDGRGATAQIMNHLKTVGISR